LFKISKGIREQQVLKDDILVAFRSSKKRQYQRIQISWKTLSRQADASR